MKTLTLPIRQLGLQGELKDFEPQDLPINAVRFARNCRIEDNALRSYSNAAEFLPDVASETYVFAHPFWRSEDNEGMIVVVEVDPGPTIEVRFYDRTGAATDITPAGGLSAATVWWGEQLGDWFILTNDNGTDLPQQTDSALSTMVDLPGWPSNYTANVIVNYKNILVAIGLTKDAVIEPRMVKSAHPFSPGDTTTFWDFTDPTLIATEAVLAEPGRKLIAAQRVSDSLMLYFDRKTWRMDLVGGQNTFNYEKVFEDDGCVSAHAHCVGHGGAVVFGHRDIYVHDGYSKQSLTDLKNTKWLYDTVDLGYPIVAERYPKRNELIFLLRTNNSGEGNILLTFNELHQAWTETIAELNGSGILNHITVAIRPSTSVTAYSDWTTETIDTFDETTYSDLIVGDNTVTLYGVSETNGIVYDMDYPGDTAPVSDFRDNLLIERTGIDLDEIGEGVGNKIAYLGRVYPQITGAGEVKFTFGIQAYPNQSITWLSPVTFDIDADYAVDVRLAGRYLAYRIESADLDNPPLFSISGMDIEVVDVGEV